MELKEAITIMILFATFVVALLLTYIGNNYKRK
ncbi:MAG: putative holin-like toxin [Paenibacillus macerans]|nr:putative holin-like toxin [Paenibacillus macerans]MDU7476849.1 putative holin-like toxin [Paenibacillus macerans]UMV45706.1 putative holin-like toxin [Paenibacillus macerans]